MAKKMILWVLVAGWAVLIFHFSAQPVEQSARLSASITEKVLNSLPQIRSMPPAKKHQIIKDLHNFMRKLAHFSLYLVLGLLVAALLFSHAIPFHRAFWIALVICLLYAAGDELHQLYVPGRGGQALDVLIDSSGGAAGILLCETLLGYLKKSFRSGKQFKEKNGAR